MEKAACSVPSPLLCLPQVLWCQDRSRSNLIRNNSWFGAHRQRYSPLSSSATLRSTTTILVHPRGRKFQASELRQHKEQWLGVCRDHPEVFVHSQPPPEAGSLERLLNELEFNLAVAKGGRVAGRFAVIQFQRAIADGTFTWISEKLKNAIMGAYVAINEANFDIDRLLNSPPGTSRKFVYNSLEKAKVPIQSAIDALLAEAES